jgi:hypothetical protein
MSFNVNLEKLRATGRNLQIALAGDPDLGPLKELPGLWTNDNLPGRGWNMIALPFATRPDSPLDYRLLVNQYNENLLFKLVDKTVPNRGVKRDPSGTSTQQDQFVVTLDYEQKITQMAAADFPESGLAGGPDRDIHHEPGLWLFSTNLTSEGLINRDNPEGLDIARLGTVPHGDSILALGKARQFDGPPTIPVLNGLPVGVNQDLSSGYLAPYAHFEANLFEGLFNPVSPADLLNAANQGVNIRRTTELAVDTAIESGGILNIPFIVKEANATKMKSFFWIQELEEVDQFGMPKFRLQYLQTVFLDFFARRDGMPGLIGWPHVSINTMERVPTPPSGVGALENLASPQVDNSPI